MEKVQLVLEKVFGYEGNHRSFVNWVKKTDKMLVFDMDGTVTEAKWCKDRISVIPANCIGITKENLKRNMYAEMRFVPVTDSVIRFCIENEIPFRVLTLISDSIEVFNKIQLLSEHYEVDFTNFFMGVTTKEQKLEVLKYWAEEQSVLYVDDSLEALLRFETAIQEEQSEKYLHNIRLVHLSTLLCSDAEVEN